jgi:hypothetical protein
LCPTLLFCMKKGGEIQASVFPLINSIL